MKKYLIFFAPILFLSLSNSRSDKKEITIGYLFDSIKNNEAKLKQTVEFDLFLKIIRPDSLPRSPDRDIRTLILEENMSLRQMSLCCGVKKFDEKEISPYLGKFFNPENIKDLPIEKNGNLNVVLVKIDKPKYKGDYAICLFYSKKDRAWIFDAFDYQKIDKHVVVKKGTRFFTH